MNSGDVLIRDTDGKRFKVRLLSHWRDVVAEDGERATVKWMGGNKYVAPKGPTLTLSEAGGGAFDPKALR